MERWPQRSPPFGRCRCSCRTLARAALGRVARTRRDSARRRRAGHAGQLRQPADAVLAEQAERARGRRRPGASERARGRRQRQHRHGGLQRRRRQHVPVHRRASACPAIYFSFDSGTAGRSRRTRGLSARNCLGAPGDADPACRRIGGPIGTLPNYFENGLVSDGDPARGVRPAPDGRRRLLLRERVAAVLREPRPRRCPGTAPFKGAEAIAVSHTDDVDGRSGRRATPRGATR